MKARGFTLLPVVLAMSLVAAIGYMLNRSNGANASLIGTSADRERARYAAEAGLQAANATIQSIGCGGGFPVSASPVTDSNFEGAAYSAYASSTSGSPLTLSSTGTFNGVSVTLTKANAHVYQSGIRTWVAQPGPVAGKDATVRNDPGSVAKNYGGRDDLEIDNDREILIAFNLAPLPAGSRIVRAFSAGALQPGAVISLYQDDSAAQDEFNVMLITQNWVEGDGNGSTPNAGSPGVSWNRWDGVSPNTWAQGPGNGYDPRTLITIPEPSSGWADIYVTSAAQAWLSGVYPNYGVWLKPDSGNTDKYKFVSSNETGGFKPQRPKFTAFYLLPCGASAPADAIEG